MATGQGSHWLHVVIKTKWKFSLRAKSTCGWWLPHAPSCTNTEHFGNDIVTLDSVIGRMVQGAHGTEKSKWVMTMTKIDEGLSWNHDYHTAPLFLVSRGFSALIKNWDWWPDEIVSPPPSKLSSASPPWMPRLWTNQLWFENVGENGVWTYADFFLGGGGLLSLKQYDNHVYSILVLDK